MIAEVYFYGSHDCLVYFSMLLLLAATLIIHLYFREIVMVFDCSPKNCGVTMFFETILLYIEFSYFESLPTLL